MGRGFQWPVHKTNQGWVGSQMHNVAENGQVGDARFIGGANEGSTFKSTETVQEIGPRKPIEGRQIGQVVSYCHAIQNKQSSLLFEAGE